jgi:chaperonin cofactor prefoldin
MSEDADKEQTLEITPEDLLRMALEDHIESLERELSHAKQREARLQGRLDELVDRLGKKSRWW